MKTVLYLRGKPGTGKITVARLLGHKLGFRLFWFHDIKNAVYGIVEEHRIPRLMDEVTAPIIKYLLEKGEDIIYVRPSPDKETVEKIRELVAQYPDYRFVVVRLEASYETLSRRVEAREDPFRITTKEDLSVYLDERAMANIEGEHVVATDDLSPSDVAEVVLSQIGLN